MPLLPVWASVLLGLLVGFLPLVGMEPMGGAQSDSGRTDSPKPLSSPSDSNCSHLTLKLEFSTTVVEHGKGGIFQNFFKSKCFPAEIIAVFYPTLLLAVLKSLLNSAKTKNVQACTTENSFSLFFFHSLGLQLTLTSNQGL